jgi:hypothetical protein
VHCLQCNATRTRTHARTHTHTHTHTHMRARATTHRGTQTDTKNTRRTGFHSNSWRSIGEWTSQLVSAGSSPSAGFSTARVIHALSSLWPRGPCSAKQVGRGGRLRVSVRMRSRPQGVARPFEPQHQLVKNATRTRCRSVEERETAVATMGMDKLTCMCMLLP